MATYIFDSRINDATEGGQFLFTVNAPRRVKRVQLDFAYISKLIGHSGLLSIERAAGPTVTDTIDFSGTSFTSLADLVTFLNTALVAIDAGYSATSNTFPTLFIRNTIQITHATQDITIKKNLSATNVLLLLGMDEHSTPTTKDIVGDNNPDLTYPKYITINMEFASSEQVPKLVDPVTIAPKYQAPISHTSQATWLIPTVGAVGEMVIFKSKDYMSRSEFLVDKLSPNTQITLTIRDEFGAIITPLIARWILFINFLDR